MVAGIDAALVMPNAVGNNNLTDTVAQRVNNFVTELNQIGLDIMGTELPGQTMIELQKDYNEMMDEIQIASKIAGETVKAINTLSNMQ